MPTPTFKLHFIYWILPSAITLLCSIVYFLNPFNLAEVIAPDFNREFGLVENIQLALLVIIFCLSIKGFRSRTIKLEKYGFLLLAMATAFIFLEEIDYGLHYIEYFQGKTQAEVKYEMEVEKKIRNVHNSGHLNGKFKFTSYVFIVVFFVVLPLIPKRISKQNRLLNFFTPSQWIITTAISLLITNKIAFFFYKNYNLYNRSLDRNVTEFEEGMIYYIIMLYVWEMVKKPEGLLFKKEQFIYVESRPAYKEQEV
jgi:hypothetical protein